MTNPWKDYSETIEYKIAPDGMDAPRTIRRAKIIPLNIYGAYYDVFFQDIEEREERFRQEEQERRLECLRENRAGLTNLLFHYLYTEDRNHSITPCYAFKIYCENLIIRDGAFGGKIRALFLSLSERRRNIILFYMVQKYVLGRRECLFADASRELFGHVRLIPTPEKLIFWTPEADSQENQAALTLCQSLFLNLGEIVDAYWGAPVGVIGENMRIDYVQAVYPLEDNNGKGNRH